MKQTEVKELASKLFAESYEKNSKEYPNLDPDLMTILVEHDVSRCLPKGYSVGNKMYNNGTIVLFLKKEISNIGAINISPKEDQND